MPNIWQISEIEKTTDGQYYGSDDSAYVQAIEIDSRQCTQGSLFIALKGEYVDGHNYIQKVLEQGGYAMAEYVPDGITDNSNIILVDSCLNALSKLAIAARQRIKGKVIAITGSVGKTTAKEMLAHVLQSKYKTHATAGNFNNELGTPITLARMPSDTQYAVIELGMNHAGELLRLTNLVKPDVAVITNIGHSHLEHFKNQQAIAAAKAEILDGLQTNGIAVLNADDKFYDYLSAQTDKPIISFNTKNTDNVLGITANIIKSILDALSLPAGLASVAQSFNQPRGRGQVSQITIEGKNITLIDDCYNASPQSTEMAIKQLGNYSGRKIAILGDMLELGDASQSLHNNLLQPLLDAKIDKVFTLGDYSYGLFNKLPKDMQGIAYTDISTLIQSFPGKLNNGDIVLVKGSNGMGLSKLIDSFK